MLPNPEWGGKLLVENVNKYLKENNQEGLLFCKEQLIKFYSKYNWELISPERVHFSTPHEGVFTMVYNRKAIVRLDYGDRFF